jgi:hypothetical protein
MKKCQAITANGTRCQRIVTSSQDYCYSHDPGRSEERRRNAARGGRVKGTGEVTKLKAQLQQLADDTLAGTVERGVAAVVNQIYGQILAAIRTELKLRELQEFESRLEELESALQKRRKPYGT